MSKNNNDDITVDFSIEFSKDGKKAVCIFISEEEMDLNTIYSVFKTVYKEEIKKMSEVGGLPC